MAMARIVRRRQRAVWLCLLGALIIAGLYCLLAEPSYVATTVLLVQSEDPQVVKVDQVVGVHGQGQDYFRTQVKMLQSRRVAEKVVRELDLSQDPEFNPVLAGGFMRAIGRWLGGLLPGRDQTQGSAPAATVDAYLEHLKVLPVINSRLIKVSFVSRDPELAARASLAHAQAFIDMNLELRVLAAQDALAWLQKRLAEFRAKLRASEEALQRFKEREDIMALENLVSAGDEERITSQRLAELNSRLTEARTERIAKQTLHEQLKELAGRPEMTESLPQVIDNPLIQKLKGDYIELARRYSEMAERYGDKHPRMVALRAEMQSLRGRLALEVGKIAKSVEITYQVALARERSLQKALDQTKEQAQRLNKKAIEYVALKREVQQNRQLYEMIMRRAKETALTSGLRSSNITIVDRSEVPARPASPRPLPILALAALLGIMAGLGLAFALHYLDNTFHDPEDLRRTLDAPLLGSVGRLEEGAGDELVVLRSAGSHFKEALWAIAANLRYSFAEAGPRALAVCSPGPGEGKTLVAANLALVLAQMGAKVVLVDGDLRKPRAHKIFGAQPEPGLTDLLSGQAELDSCLRPTPVDGLRFLPCGFSAPGPAELLSSGALPRLLAELKGRADFVVLDTPPVHAVADALVVAGQVDGALLVVRAEQTAKPAARQAAERLAEAGGRVLGAVLNQWDLKRRGSYEYYDRYQYYYTKGGSEGRKGRPRA